MMKCVVAAAIVSSLAGLAMGQSLGEIAKKEKERRKKNEERGLAVRTLSTEEIATRPSVSAKQSAPEDDWEPETETEAGSTALPTAASSSTTAAPPFTLADRNGRRVSLRDFRGRPVLLDFWATWCGPCRATMPEVERLHRKYGRRGLEVVGVNIEGRTPGALSYLDQGGYSFLVLFDSGNGESEVARRYQVSSIPRTFLINGDGNIVFSGHPNGLSESLIETTLR
jgi:thiol-disulfide isomerase/thioredoxin